MMVNVKDLRVKCLDGVELAATLFIPEQLKAAVMIGPATGIKRRFYQSFATFLAENGYGVITFDNRGIGDSSSELINKIDASLQIWGERDMPAILERLKTEFPGVDYHLIGHSAGGQLVGLMPNAFDIKSMFNFACSSGSLSNMKMPFLLNAKFFMNWFIPFSNAIYGHTKSQWVGMGEPLPKNVAKQWADWCNGKGYVKMGFGKTIKWHCYNDLNMPSIWINAIDDDIAITENVKDMISVFTKMETKIITLKPQDHSLKEIGHMKFFSKDSKVLWTMATDWLEGKAI